MYSIIICTTVFPHDTRRRRTYGKYHLSFAVYYCLLDYCNLKVSIHSTCVIHKILFPRTEDQRQSTTYKTASSQRYLASLLLVAWWRHVRRERKKEAVWWCYYSFILKTALLWHSELRTPKFCSYQPYQTKPNQIVIFRKGEQREQK